MLEDIEVFKHCKILIVDDLAENHKVLGNILKDAGLNCISALNGVQAMALVEAKSPDLILLDIQMPDMDGFEVCKKLKSESFTMNIPIIFLTAKSDSKDVVEGLRLGAVDYISKPFNPDELIVRVLTHLDLKLAKDKIESQNIELTSSNEKIESYANELLELNEKLYETNVTKDKFFSIIAHDLRSPFSGIIGVSEEILNNAEFFDKDEIIKLVRDINGSMTSVYKLIGNLLDWARVQTGKIEFEPNEFNFYEIAFNNIYILNPKALEKNITIESKVDQHFIFDFDYNMLNTVVRNLISNAVKFTNVGGKIILSASFEVFDNTEVVVIKVSDNGVGISEDNIAKLFRIDVYHSTVGTAKEKGTGIGLILCKEFIEKHLGSIEVESKFKKGTVFTVILPKHQKINKSNVNNLV